jgi:hypothetical protein
MEQTHHLAPKRMKYHNLIIEQRHHSNELEFGPPNSTVPNEIDFKMYTNNNDMDKMDDTATTLMLNFVGHSI